MWYGKQTRSLICSVNVFFVHISLFWTHTCSRVWNFVKYTSTARKYKTIYISIYFGEIKTKHIMHIWQWPSLIEMQLRKLPKWRGCTINDEDVQQDVVHARLFGNFLLEFSKIETLLFELCKVKAFEKSVAMNSTYRPRNFQQSKTLWKMWKMDKDHSMRCFFNLLSPLTFKCKGSNLDKYIYIWLKIVHWDIINMVNQKA